MQGTVQAVFGKLQTHTYIQCPVLCIKQQYEHPVQYYAVQCTVHVLLITIQTFQHTLSNA
jgi:hypothetical protein